MAKLLVVLLLIAAVAVRLSGGFMIALTKVSPSTLELSASTPEQSNPTHVDNSQLDPTISSDFTIQVCTSTNCSKRLQNMGLDQYHILGEIYARAEERNVHKCMIIEDGACLGGKNCKLGPCVAIKHDDFDGNVALDGMSSNEFRERV
jgi:hypothetical protein